MSLKHREDGILTPFNIIQILGAILSILVVSVLYGFVIRPSAQEYEIAKTYEISTAESDSMSIYVILKDYEQQACITMMLWVFMILVYKLYTIHSERKILRNEEYSHDHADNPSQLIQYPESGVIYREDASGIISKINARINSQQDLENKLLPHLINKGLERFINSQSIQEASDAIKERVDVVADRLDSELSIVRYIAWAIPSVGFIGTVRGIGAALSKANEAIEGDISGVTSSLGLAFNSTLVALFISIFLMFFIHLLQSRQEGTMLAIETFCREHLIDKLRVSKDAS